MIARALRPARPGLDRLGAVLRPSESILAVLAVVSVVAAVGFVAVTSSFTWAADIQRNLSAGRAILDGRFGTVEGYLYTPFAALLTVPLLALPGSLAILAWLVAKVALLVVATARSTIGLSARHRVLIALAVVTFLPVIHDLALGNVTVFVALAIAAVAWSPDRFATGVPFGILLAATPKPVLIPVLIWMAVWRRRALGSSVVVAGVATLATVVIVGLEPYEAWVGALLDPPILSGGNFALSALPAPLAVPAAVLTVAATLIAIRRGDSPGLVAAIACGLLVSTYTVLYGAAAVLASAPLFARAAPRAAIVLALVAPVALLAAFPVWVGALVVVALAVPAERWPGAAR